MNNRLAPVLLILFISLQASAQSDTTFSQMSGFVSMHSGTLFGEPGNPASISVMLMPGVRLNRVTMTAGAGCAKYSEWKTVPVFAGVGYDFLKRRHYALFVHCNAGYARAWHSSPEFYRGDIKNEGGHFYHPFFGVRVNSGRLDMYFSAGYKFQSLTYEQIPERAWAGFKTTTRASMQRLSIQMGIGIH